MPSFARRVRDLPHLGLGLSTEHGVGDLPGVVDPFAVRAAEPSLAALLEVGVEVAKGLDPYALAWAGAGLPTTYHFLDVNLDDPEDLDPEWLDGVRAARDALRPAWMCGDAGLWHFGARDRGHMLLLPPILVAEAVGPMADGIRALREATGLEVLPENPPGAVFVGDLHLLDFFGRLAEAADTGLLLDCSHLVMYQRATGRGALDALDGFPLDRVVELHVAGGAARDHVGLAWIEDDHGPEVLDDVWRVVDHVLPRAPELRAVIVECERNPIDAALPLLRSVQRRWRAP
ncbi:MAG TPA: DUF692 family protein [Myxococcota bacterium]|nr:DUF692 family protein [Myxococcota bacterium]